METPEADVYQGTKCVGHFYRTQRGARLEVANPDGDNPKKYPGLFTASIDFGETVLAETQNLPNYFLNLLPEGVRLQQLSQAKSHHAQDDLLGLIQRIGRNMIGDIDVVPHKQPLALENTEKKFENFSDAYESLYGNALERTAIAGVQEKLSGVSISIYSTQNILSIIKLNPKNYPSIVENENFFLQMANHCGIRAANAILVRDTENQAGLIVTRFDRILSKNGSITKLHQEDMCQILNETPANKYNIPFKQIAGAIQEYATSSKSEILTLLQQLAFSYMIGNADHHAKNISLIWNPNETVTVSPAYDVISTLPYRHHDQYMVIPLQGKNKNFKAATFIATGTQYGIPERATQTMLQKLTKKAEPWIAKLNHLPYDEKTIAFLQEEIESRRKALTPD